MHIYLSYFSESKNFFESAFIWFRFIICLCADSPMTALTWTFCEFSVFSFIYWFDQNSTIMVRTHIVIWSQQIQSLIFIIYNRSQRYSLFTILRSTIYIPDLGIFFVGSDSWFVFWNRMLAGEWMLRYIYIVSPLSFFLPACHIQYICVLSIEY